MTKVRVNVLPVNVKTGRIMNPVRVNRPDVIIWRRINGLRVKNGIELEVERTV